MFLKTLIFKLIRYIFESDFSEHNFSLAAFGYKTQIVYYLLNNDFFFVVCLLFYFVLFHTNYCNWHCFFFLFRNDFNN